MHHDAGIGKAIREAMKRDPRSLYQLELECGVTRSQLGRFLKGERELTVPAADKLCKVLGLELRPVRRRRKKA